MKAIAISTILVCGLLMPSTICSSVAPTQIQPQARVNEASNQQIVAMGHREWIAKVLNQPDHTLDQLEDAERKFSWAQTLENEKVIKRSSRAEDFEHLQIMLANITKSAFVIGDYTMLDVPHDHLYVAKSTSLAAIALRNILFNAPTPEKLLDSSVWKLLEETKKVHESQADLIEKFKARKGGFSAKQLLLEYDRMAGMMKDTYGSKALSSVNQKQQYLLMCRNFIGLTLGKDPLPYKS